MKIVPKINWLARPKKNNYPAALSYLLLTFKRKKAERLVEKLRRAKIVTFKAKDIFRASRLSLLGVSNSHVQDFKARIKAGEELSPILLVREPEQGRVIIADGYHRLCAVYYYHEDADIPCQIV